MHRCTRPSDYLDYMLMTAHRLHVNECTWMACKRIHNKYETQFNLYASSSSLSIGPAYQYQYSMKYPISKLNGSSAGCKHF